MVEPVVRKNKKQGWRIAIRGSSKPPRSSTLSCAFICPQYPCFFFACCPDSPWIFSGPRYTQLQWDNKQPGEHAPSLVFYSAWYWDSKENQCHLSFSQFTLPICVPLPPYSSTFLVPNLIFHPCPPKKKLAGRLVKIWSRMVEAGDNGTLLWSPSARPGKGKEAGLRIVLLPAWARIQATAFLSRSSHSHFKSLPLSCSQITARMVAQPEESTSCTVDRELQLAQ